MDYSKFAEPTKKAFRKRLRDSVCKHIDTVMIYPLSQFEQTFGYIWGHGEHLDNLSPEQLQMLTLWKDCRNRILNNGNRHKRLVTSEMDEYDIFWHRHTMVLVPRKDDRNE